MQPVKRIVIVAAEESGDMHAASFIRDLKSKNPNIEISGLGGNHMLQAGMQLIQSPSYFGSTGISEVFRHLRRIKQAYSSIKAHLVANKPDLLVLIDCPGFNLRLAKFAKKKLGIRVLYYISPQIWAWKANRIHTIKKYIDRMAVIFPFEKKIYEQAGVPVSFVGHPLVEKMTNQFNSKASRIKLSLPLDKRLVALLPGSRVNEIDRHMPILLESAKILHQQYPDLHFAVPIAGSIHAETIADYFKDSTIPFTLIQANAVELMACSDCVAVASGTASLECALLEKPMCIIYKASTLTYIAASKLIKVKYLGLCNLLQNKMIVPELLQYDCNANELAKVMGELLDDNLVAENMTHRLNRLKTSLSTQLADCTISEIIWAETYREELSIQA